MSEGNNRWRCPYCDGLNGMQDEICQICGDGRRPDTAAPQIPKTYTPRERADDAPPKETPAAEERPKLYTPAAPEPEKPKKKRHGLLWTIVIVALAYGGGRLMGGQLSGFLTGGSKPEPAQEATKAPLATVISMPTEIPAADPTAAPTNTPKPKPTKTPKPTKAPTPEPTLAPTPEPAPLKKGDSGDAVAALQAVLIEHNYLLDKADGQFGGKTEAAVKQVQADAGYQQTGVADAQTQGYLQDHYGAFNPTKDSDVMMYGAYFDYFDMLNIYFKNTGRQEITSVEVRLDQCSESKSALGSFFNKRNSRSNTWWSYHSKDLSMSSGDAANFRFDLKEGKHYTFGDGSDNVVTYFDDGRFVRVTLQSYTTGDGKEHSGGSQVVYCRFR